MTMWCICCVASTYLINYLMFCDYLHGNTLVVALHSTTVATVLHENGYYIGAFSFVSLGINAITVVECVQFQEEYYYKSGPKYYITGNFLNGARRESIPGFLCLL